MSDKQPTHNGIQLDIISSERIDRLGEAEKIDLIIRSVQDGNLVVLQKGLTSDEKTALIERTMGVVEPDTFSGIEIETFQRSSSSSSGGDGGVLGRASSLLGGSDEEELEDELTLIGPAERLKTIKNEDDVLRAFVSE